jgi:hypothetical protein
MLLISIKKESKGIKFSVVASCRSDSALKLMKKERN